MLKQSGYNTAAVQTHPMLTINSGFGKGFQFYDDSNGFQRRANEAASSVSKLIEELKGPWFIWVHIFDPHFGYAPPAEYRTRFGQDLRVPELYNQLQSGQVKIGSVIFQNHMPLDEVQSFINLYDAELYFTDHGLGVMIDALQKADLMEKTVIAVTADHGESLGEHNYFFEHGDFGSQPEIHVPLVLYAQDLIPAGKRIHSTISSIDVAPTLLELLQISYKNHLSGKSLIPLIKGSENQDRICMGETDESFHQENTRREVRGLGGRWRWLVLGQYKLTDIPRANGTSDRHLYDLKTDPQEANDCSNTHSEIVRKMSPMLDVFVKESLKPGEHYELTDEDREKLRSLGYTN